LAAAAPRSSRRDGKQGQRVLNWRLAKSSRRVCSTSRRLSASRGQGETRRRRVATAAALLGEIGGMAGHGVANAAELWKANRLDTAQRPTRIDIRCLLASYRLNKYNILYLLLTYLELGSQASRAQFGRWTHGTLQGGRWFCLFGCIGDIDGSAWLAYSRKQRQATIMLRRFARPKTKDGKQHAHLIGSIL
jgi:hypothetical protein